MTDIFIRDADWIITVDAQRRIITSGAIAIRDGQIVEIGKTNDLEQQHASARRVIDARGKVILPGLIDGHMHSAFHLSRGLADGVSAQKFLFERMYPYEGLLTEEESYWSAMLCVLELLRNGVTTFIDAGTYHPHQTAKAVGEVGIRCIVAKSALDITKSSFGKLPERFIETTDQAVERAEKVVQEWNGAYNGRIRAWFQFRGIPNSTDQLITRLKELADRYGTGVQTHACFSRDTMEASKTQFGVPEIERLHRLGVLGPNLLLVHSAWVSPHELQWMIESDVKIVSSPSSSMHNGYGCILMGKIPEFLEMGLAVGLGSDHASSGIVDLVQEMSLEAGVYKEVRLNTGVMPPERVIEMATINGARCALWEKEIGSLEAGKKADVTLFNTRTPQWQPLYNPVSNLVYSATGGSVDTVICDGKILMEGRQLQTVDEEKIYDEIARLMPGILKKTNLEEKIRPKWPVI
ncbi:MAG: amidohydrolase [Acidobacteria bacterium]|nr:amidohydrolase [Acidobacteriota bacterium]MCZ6489075.1 amidohydrolase [Acidobacteriota bacterium]MCZ6753242.1 amidohydrolase [Acidobacteriota bacterium]